jgi:two-component system KDP operon response regulator KdpE
MKFCGRESIRGLASSCVADLLLIEDDADIRTALIRALTQRGHTLRSESTGMAGLQGAIDQRPELVLLDLGLPDVDGRTVLTMLRAVSNTPVIVLTARDEEAEVIRVLNAGADDYIVKPFAPDHLDARIRALLRRSLGAKPEDPYVVGDLRIDTRTREAFLGEDRLDLSRKEFDLLALLASRPGEVVSKRALQAEIWHQPYGGADKSLDVHLSWLRRKLGETAVEPRYLHSVRGVGVKLSAPTP